MDGSKQQKSENKSSEENASSKDKSSTRTAQSNWTAMAVKAKLTDKCLWSACKAMTAGVIFLVIGAGMATLGFYSDHLSTVKQIKGNTTVWVKNESKDSQLSSLTYLGPVVMGIGGFTIVAACVMTFEARDTAAKIVPIWFRRTRIHIVSGGSGSSPSGRSSKASWERFLGQQRPSEDAADSRSAVTQALMNFSKYLQNSIDTNKLPQRNPYISDQQMPGLRKCPSEPSLGKMLRDANGNNIPESVTLLEASTPQPSQRTAYGVGLKNTARPTKPQLLSVAPDAYRQTVSMDCPRVGRLNSNEQERELNDASSGLASEQSERIKTQTLPLQTSFATSSSGSMSVDIYLPQGAVTLKIHDDMKETRKSSAKQDDCVDSRGYRSSAHSDMHSFGEEEDFLSTECDDSVFVTQDAPFSTPQIIFNVMDSNVDQSLQTQIMDANDPLLQDKTQSVEEWSNYPPPFIQSENQTDSIDNHSAEGSPQSISLSTQFSFESSGKDSGGASIASVISNPFSSRAYDQRSLSQTDTSFMNVSSLGSMESSQGVLSPLLYPSSPRFFDFRQESLPSDPPGAEGNPSPLESRPSRIDSQGPRPRKLPESNPLKGSSLESAEIELSRAQSGSPIRQQLSSDCAMPDSLLLPTPRYLSPVAVSSPGPPSPRKTRSESLPERSQASSLKRFPLLRQVALDTFAEEGGSAHRLDRSLTQISPKEAFSPH